MARPLIAGPACSVSVLSVLLLACGGRSPIPGADGGQDLLRRGDSRAADGPTLHGDLPSSCAGYTAWGKGRQLTSYPARQALFSSTGARLAIVTHKTSGTGDLILVDMPSGGGKTLASSVRDVEWLDPTTLLASVSAQTSGPYDLVVLGVDGSSKTIGTAACWHKATSGGKRVYFVSSCDASWVGTLQVADLGTGAATTITGKVHSSSVALSADGSRAALITNPVTTYGTCGYGTGALAQWSAGQLSSLEKSGAVLSSLQLLPDNALLWQQRGGCDSSAPSTLKVTPATGTAATSLATNRYYGSTLFGHPYEVSPDGKTVLASETSMSEMQLKLYAISTAGSGESQVASDLFPFYMVSLAFQPFRFAPGGQFALYTPTTGYPGVGLAVLSSGSWKRGLISSGLFLGAHWSFSPTKQAAAFVEGNTASGSIVVTFVDLPSLQTRNLASTTAVPSTPVFLPDGRAVLFVVPQSGLSVLRYGPLKGNGSVLAEWKTSPLVQPPGALAAQPFRVDPSSCAVLFVTDQGSTPGTHLALLPR